MTDKLYLELYNFVADSNALLRKLSPENVELVDILGVVDAIDKVYEVVEREGLSRLEHTTTKL